MNTVQDMIYAAFHDAMLAARACKNMNVMKNAHRAQDSGEVAFAAEYQTVAVSMGRQCGKTQYILDHAEPGDLVLVRNAATGKSLAAHFNDGVWNGKPTVAEFVTIFDDAQRHAGKAYKNIWVDDAAYLKATYGELFDKSLYSFNKTASLDRTYFLLG